MIQVNCSDYCDGNGLCVKNTHTTDTELTRIKRQVEVLREGLGKLSKLGNGENIGNSIGNCIAIDTLAAADRIAKGEV